MSADEEGCCEEHFPSEAMSAVDQAEHICPNCGWVANPEWWEALEKGTS